MNILLGEMGNNMDIQEFQDNHYGDGEVYSEDKLVKFKNVHYDEYAEHKTVTVTEVHQLYIDDTPTEEYFEITTDSDNCGYWGDGERYEPTFRKVKRVTRMVETVYWEDV